MNAKELKDTINLKTLEFEAAMDAEQPYRELVRIYKELKELKYRLVELENYATEGKDFDLA